MNTPYAAIRRSLTGVPAILLALALPLDAQTPVRPTTPPDSQILGMMARSLRMLRPAEMVLGYKEQLQLTPEQTTRLQTMASAQAESTMVRYRRMTTLSRDRGTGGRPASAMSAVMSWSGPVDEQALRDAACAQSATQAETMINLAHDRHAVGAVLTPEQRAMLPRLEMADMARGMGGLAPRAPQGPPYFEYQVEKQAMQIPGAGVPRYPDALRAARVEGQVLASFVVDTTGRYVDGTLHVLKTSHELFTQAVRDALPLMRFMPAEIGGRKVRQLVQQPFVFALPRNE